MSKGVYSQDVDMIAALKHYPTALVPCTKTLHKDIPCGVGKNPILFLYLPHEGINGNLNNNLEN